MDLQASKKHLTSLISGQVSFLRVLKLNAVERGGKRKFLGENLIKKFSVISVTTAEVNKASRQPTGKTRTCWKKGLILEQ